MQKGTLLNYDDDENTISVKVLLPASCITSVADNDALEPSSPHFRSVPPFHQREKFYEDYKPMATVQLPARGFQPATTASMGMNRTKEYEYDPFDNGPGWDLNVKGRSPLDKKRYFERPKPLTAYSKSFSYVTGPTGKPLRKRRLNKSEAQVPTRDRDGHRVDEFGQRISVMNVPDTTDDTGGASDEQKSQQVSQQSQVKAQESKTRGSVIDKKRASFHANVDDSFRPKKDEKDSTSSSSSSAEEPQSPSLTDQTKQSISILKKASISQSTPLSEVAAATLAQRKASQRRSIRFHEVPHMEGDNKPATSSNDANEGASAGMGEDLVTQQDGQRSSRLAKSTRAKQFKKFWTSGVAFVDGEFVKLKEGQSADEFLAARRRTKKSISPFKRSATSEAIAAVDDDAKAEEDGLMPRHTLDDLDFRDFVYRMEITDELLMDCFVRYDIDKDGYLEPGELVSVMGFLCYCDLGKDMISGMVSEITSYVALDQEEFKTFVVKYHEQETQMLQYAFDKADTDDSGEIDRRELDVLLHQLGYILTPGMVDEVMRKCDTDHSGTINISEFYGLMAYFRRTEGFTHDERVEMQEAFNKFDCRGEIMIGDKSDKKKEQHQFSYCRAHAQH